MIVLTTLGHRIVRQGKVLPGAVHSLAAVVDVLVGQRRGPEYTLLNNASCMLRVVRDGFPSVRTTEKFEKQQYAYKYSITRESKQLWVYQSILCHV